MMSEEQSTKLCIICLSSIDGCNCRGGPYLHQAGDPMNAKNSEDRFYVQHEPKAEPEFLIIDREKDAGLGICGCATNIDADFVLTALNTLQSSVVIDIETADILAKTITLRHVQLRQIVLDALSGGEDAEQIHQLLDTVKLADQALSTAIQSAKGKS